MFRIHRSVFTAIVLILPTAASLQAAPEWIQQLGTVSDDSSSGVATDSLGNVYISGSTEGSLDGPNAGGRDAFLAKYDAAGTLLWTEQMGTASSDSSTAVSADLLGNVYISGSTDGSLGAPNAGSADAFLAKYDVSGNLQWIEQLGTADIDYVFGVSADLLGDVYITGITTGSLGGPYAGNEDVFLAKYNAAGSLQWTEQLGTDGVDRSFGISADSLGNVYISGATTGGLNGPNAGSSGSDVFLAKYDAAGGLQWIEQLGTADGEYGIGVVADSLGNVVVSGRTGGSLGGANAGGNDAFVAKYDATGMLLWSEQLGTSDYDFVHGVSTDSAGSIFISGFTDGSLGGPNAGGRDIFLAKYDAAGTLLWTEQLGTADDDGSLGVAADSFGNVYISGYTGGSLGGANAGGNDAFLAKFAAPEPGTLILAAFGFVALIAGRRRRGG